MAWPGSRSVACLLVFAAPACVVRLSERYSPLPNGAVTGAPADCSAVTPVPRGGPGGDAELTFVGRFDMRDPQAIRFDWSGNYISARFEGTQVSARLEAPEGDVLFSAVLDGGPPVEIHVLSPVAQPPEVKLPEAYLLFENLSPGPHEIVLHRDTEAQTGITVFRGFDFGGGGRLLPPTRRPRRIELIGDSITCGYGNEGQNATCPFDIEVRRAGKCPDGALPLDFDTRFPDCNVARVPFTQNQYLAYGSIAGRTLDADVPTLCWSGKGVERNYREPTRGPAAADAKTTVPMLWRERTLGTKRNAPDGDPNADPAIFGVPWDFASEPEPQVVVINLGTNDFTRDVLLNNQGGAPTEDGLGDNVPDGDIDRESFRATFLKFVEDVRAKRPNAHIFLAVPPMVSDQFPLDDARTDLTNTLKSIAATLESRGDKKVYAMELVEQGTRYGLGCDYHPNLRVHEIMAEQVVGAIRSKTCWD